MTRLIVLAAFAGCLFSVTAQAQGRAPAPGIDQPATWTLDTTIPRPVHGKPAAVRRAPAVSSEEADKAARLAEARRKFFEDQNKDDTPAGPVEFGGYDAKTMSGTQKPGFKF